MIERHRIDRYIKYKMKEVIYRELNGFKVGIVFADQYVSELGNTLCEKLDIDIAAIVDFNSKCINYRCIRDDIHLGKEFASLYGGGGHPKAAGSQLTKELISSVADMVFTLDK